MSCLQDKWQIKAEEELQFGHRATGALHHVSCNDQLAIGASCM